MPGAARAIIDTVHKGQIISGSPNVYINGYQAARNGDPVQPHWEEGDYHTGVVLENGSGTVFVNGMPLCRVGDAASCADVITGGSDNVFVDTEQVYTIFVNGNGDVVTMINSQGQVKFKIGS